LKRKDKENVEYQFPRLIDFSDDEMILIKNLLSRFQQKPTAQHQELIDQTAEAIAQRLKLERTPHQTQLFLETILAEYVSMTR
jgi:hypothetical protein